jgi:hypothetical protein
VLAASIISKITTLMMEAARTSEKSVNFYQTARRNNPEDSHLHTRRRENLKSHFSLLVLFLNDNIYSAARVEFQVID